MPPVDVEEANIRVGRASLTGKNALERFYGFDPEKSYLIRSPNRAYSGITNTLQFLNGTTIAPAKPHETDQWKWNRGEKLSQLRAMHYAVYEMGLEPAPDHEPLWKGQPGTTELQTNEFGMEFGVRYERREALVMEPRHEADGLGQPTG